MRMSTPEMGKRWIETVYLQTAVKTGDLQFSGPYAAYFTELMERQKGAKYFIGMPIDILQRPVQGHLRPGDEHGLPRRPAHRRRGGEDDEPGLLQGLSLAVPGNGRRRAATPPRRPSRPCFVVPPTGDRPWRPRLPYPSPLPPAGGASVVRLASGLARHDRCLPRPRRSHLSRPSPSIRCCAPSTTASTRSGRRTSRSSSGSSNFAELLTQRSGVLEGGRQHRDLHRRRHDRRRAGRPAAGALPVRPGAASPAACASSGSRPC